MTDRFSPLALLKIALDSLRRRSVLGVERRDWWAVSLLLAVPFALGVVSFCLRWVIRDSGGLTAAFALMAGSLFACVPQLASWRQRLADRDRVIEGIPRRKLDEAVANTLVGVVVSITLAGLSVILGNISLPDPGNTGGQIIPWVARVLTAIFCTGSAYLFLTLLLVVNLVFDAYQDANGSAKGSPDSQRELNRWTDDGAA